MEHSYLLSSVVGGEMLLSFSQTYLETKGKTTVRKARDLEFPTNWQRQRLHTWNFPCCWKTCKTIVFICFWVSETSHFPDRLMANKCLKSVPAAAQFSLLYSLTSTWKGQGSRVNGNPANYEWLNFSWREKKNFQHLQCLLLPSARINIMVNNDHLTIQIMMYNCWPNGS